MSLSLAEYIVAGALALGVTGFVGTELATIFQPTPVEEVATAIEEWHVTVPDAEIPETDGYIEYTEFRTDKFDKVPYALQETLPVIARAGNTWVKISVSESGSPFMICTHKGDDANAAGEDIISYDSVTGEEITNETEVCQ